MRLIPARAGKTVPARAASGGAQAHPRACGENQEIQNTQMVRDGSSPRVRGKLISASRFAPAVRLIPARAGKTGPTPGKQCPSRAHPRACGENLSPPTGFICASGSSPRVRGKRPPNAGELAAHRLIPARAGKTDGEPVIIATESAHPRACGEN